MEIEKPAILDAAEPVSRAINEISRSGLPVFVIKDKRYIGIIDERAIRQRADASKEKCGSVAERTPALSPESTVMEACRAFFAGRFKAIPVIAGGKIEGAITRHTLLNELLKEKMLSRTHVSEVMTAPVSTLDSKATIGQARSELRRQNVRRLVVTEKGKLAGIFSVFDLASMLTAPRGHDVNSREGDRTSTDSQPIASYMKKEVERINSRDSLASAVRKMLEQRVAALVVADGEYPIGIVTAKDILHAALAEEKAVRVFVSGLPHEQRDYQEEMVREGEKLLLKIGKSVEVRSLAFHVKYEGSGFAVRARLDGKRPLNASAFDFRLPSAMRATLSDLEKMAGKGKPDAKLKRMAKSRGEDE